MPFPIVLELWVFQQSMKAEPFQDQGNGRVFQEPVKPSPFKFHKEPEFFRSLEAAPCLNRPAWECSGKSRVATLLHWHLPTQGGLHG